MTRMLSHLLPFVAILVFASQCRAQIDAGTALSRIGDFMVGTWTPTIQQDKVGPRKHVYDWALNKKFVRVNGDMDPAPWHGYMGVDLSNNKVGWWGFFADGSSGVIYLTKFTDGEWVFEGDDFGPNGKFRRKVTVHLPADGKLHAKMEDTLDGKTTVVETDWVRQR